ncbi:MAG: response regulator [Nitrospinota bacterium]|nr:response regulator [Nitrospinota bacterium]
MPKPRALIFEDNKTYSVLFNRVIRDLGYRVDFAKTTAESQPLIEKHDYALALISLSVGDGTEGLRCVSEIKERDKTLNRKETPILAVSVTEGPQFKEQALENGAHGCLARNNTTHQKIRNSIKEAITKVDPEQLPEALKFIYR